MDESEVDAFADEYRAMHAANIKLSGEDPEFFAEYKIKDVADRVKALRRHARSSLDFGSGVGNSIPHFRKWMANSDLVGPRRRCGTIMNTVPSIRVMRTTRGGLG